MAQEDEVQRDCAELDLIYGSDDDGDDDGMMVRRRKRLPRII